MKILLIEPMKPRVALGGEEVFLFEPLALEYVAAGVKEKHEVKILDLRLEKKMDEVLNDFDPEIVGITAYTVHVNPVKKLFEKVKKWKPDVLTVVGGHHATVKPHDFQTQFIDLIVIGEGVGPFQEIVKRFENKGDFSDIPGVAFQRDGVLEITDPLILEDIDSLPFPDRSLTTAYRKHYYCDWMKPLASIRTSKGCPFRCNFCALWKLTRGRYLKRKPEKILEELLQIEEENIFFADDESLFDTARMEILARLIKESGIKKKYFLYARSDTICKHPELLKSWKDIGLDRVLVGLEFFRDEDLKFVNKGIKIEDNEKAVKILHDFGIDIYAAFILRPEFIKEDFRRLRKYCRDLEVDLTSFAVLTPLPGTEYYEEVKEQLIVEDYDYFDFCHTLLPTKLPLKEFYKEFDRLIDLSLSFSKRMALLRKFPLKDIPALICRSFRFYSRLKRVHLDYMKPAEEYDRYSI